MPAVKAQLEEKRLLFIGQTGTYYVTPPFGQNTIRVQNEKPVTLRRGAGAGDLSPAGCAPFDDGCAGLIRNFASLV